MDLIEDLPNDRYFVEIEIPDDIIIQEVKLQDLPTKWDTKPPSFITQTIGDDFVLYNEAAILIIPSCIIPQEFNYLINSNHKAVSRIKVLSKIKMKFDSRLKTI